MKIIDLVQGSEEWHEFRKNHIGASIAPIIMNQSVWSTPYKLWSQMVGLTANDETNDRMQRGIDLEKKARECFEKKSKLKFNPCVGESSEIPYISASFDGFNFEKREAVEIKCPGLKDHQTALQLKTPIKYVAQLQHQMYVANLDYIYYFSYVSDDDNAIVVVNRDCIYIEEMLKKEKEFWNCLQTFTPPEMKDKDYQKIDSVIFNQKAKDWHYANSTAKYWKDIADKERDMLIEMCGGQSSISDSIKLTKYPVRGKIDCNKLCLDLGIDAEKYRKESTEQWRISEV